MIQIKIRLNWIHRNISKYHNSPDIKIALYVEKGIFLDQRTFLYEVENFLENPLLQLKINRFNCNENASLSNFITLIQFNR